VTVAAVETRSPAALHAAQPRPSEPPAVSSGVSAATGQPSSGSSDAPRRAAVAPLAERVRPDVLVTAAAPLGSQQLNTLARHGRMVVLRAGTVTVSGRPAQVLAVDPSSFRPFAAEGTAESDAVWQSVGRGEIAASHAFAEAAALQLGGLVGVSGATGGPAIPLRVGALATTGVPRSELVVDDATGERLGLPPTSGVLLAAPAGTDPRVLGAAVRAAVGDAAQIDLLAPAASDPVAFLTGGKAAQAFGSFSYRYYPDGTIEPDPAWVRANIVDATVPILGRVTCHRLMIPQLRGALQEVQDAGLAGLLHTYDGCFVPKFIPDTNKAVSLHAWGIAIDMDASTNYRGIRGTMDERIVAIFKKWGFRWGGDWHYTDPMHFELGALLVDPKR
jgi:hypothetical protein